MKVRILQSSNAPKFLLLRIVFNKIEITLTKSSTYKPHRNGLEERMNTTFLNKMWATPAETHIDSWFWDEAALHAPEIKCWRAPPVPKIRNAIEVLLLHAADNSKVINFGCTALIQEHRKWGAAKLDNRSELGRYLSTSYGQFRYAHRVPRWMVR